MVLEKWHSIADIVMWADTWPVLLNTDSHTHYYWTGSDGPTDITGQSMVHLNQQQGQANNSFFGFFRYKLSNTLLSDTQSRYFQAFCTADSSSWMLACKSSMTPVNGYSPNLHSTRQYNVGLWVQLLSAQPAVTTQAVCSNAALHV